jgi:serine/threonine protein phosphatase 1
MSSADENQPFNRIIAIGDIHGCSLALRTLIDTISPQTNDLIIPVGDYVDRGPDSRGVVEQLIELSRRCQLVPLLGNHEIMMLAAVQDHDISFWLECGGDATLNSYGGEINSIPEEHFAFLSSCHRYYETAEHIFVHANYQYDLPLNRQPDHLLFWTHISYAAPPPHQSGKTVIVGHTPQATGEVLDLNHLIGIDTYCFGTGWLTAINAETREVWQADKEGVLRRN